MLRLTAQRGIQRPLTHSLWQLQRRSLAGKIISKSSKLSDKARKGNIPLVDLPRVVLDLDAEDNPHVRPVTEEDVAQLRDKWGADQAAMEMTKAKVLSLQQQVMADYRLMQSVTSDPFNKWQISDHDVLSVALLGGSNVQLTFSEANEGYCGSLLRVLRENGIPSRILDQDANKVVDFMLHRQRTASQTAGPGLEGQQSENDSTIEGLGKSISACNDLSELRRLVGRFMSLESAEVLFLCSDAIAAVCGGHIRGLGARDADILGFLNNLTMNQVSRGFEANKNVCLLGLHLASALPDLPSLMRYLTVCLHNDWFSSEQHGHDQNVPWTRIATLRNSAGKLKNAMSALTKAVSEQETLELSIRSSLFTLVTGYDLDGFRNPSVSAAILPFARPQPDTHNPSKFHLHHVSTFDLDHLYLQLLAELGGLRTLWHEWKAQQAPSDGRSATTGIETRPFADLVRRCLQVLSPWASSPGTATRRQGGEDLRFKATGSADEDAVLDLQTISRLECVKTVGASQVAPEAGQRTFAGDAVLGFMDAEDLPTALRHIWTSKHDSPATDLSEGSSV